MALTFTRRPGESFTLTCPTGEQRTVTVHDIGVKNVYIDSGAGLVSLRHGQPFTLGVPGDKSLVEIGLARNAELGGKQVKLYVDAPASVCILRDNAKCREAKV